MKIIAAFVFFLFLTGCSVAPFSKSLKPYPQQQDQELFFSALDQFSTSNKLTLMHQLQQQSPDSVWAAYAETIIRYARELDARKAQLSQEREEKQRLLAELDSIKQKNKQLNEKFEQLKALLIELEQRPQ
ncbi:MAG: hypothetical protein GXP51_11995 [Deltaproteobacteria bacterium]|nr:hypothetical protein [Deltaproteobacteria bacterium]